MAHTVFRIGLRRTIIGAVCVAGGLALMFGVHRSKTQGSRVDGRDFPDALAAPFDTIRVDEATTIVDATGTESQLFLLDRASFKVIVLEKIGRGQLQVTRSFGARGGGPGELLAPLGIAAQDSLLIISDSRRLLIFDTAGNFRRTLTPRFPCEAAAIYPVVADHGFVVAAECITGRDTISAGLFASDSGRVFRLLASEVRFTVSGGIGSQYYALRAASDPLTGVLFGIGARPCVVALRGKESMETKCGDLQPYASPPPASLARLPRRAPTAQQWPDPLPYYFDRTTVAGAIAVWRPFRADSIVLQTLDGRSLLLAGLNGFINCRRAGCLWAVHLTDGMELHWLPQSRIDSLAHRSHER